MMVAARCRSGKGPHFQHPRKIANLKTQGFPCCPWYIYTLGTRGFILVDFHDGWQVPPGFGVSRKRYGECGGRHFFRGRNGFGTL
jgi:hypothetical protein